MKTRCWLIIHGLLPCNKDKLGSLTFHSSRKQDGNQPEFLEKAAHGKTGIAIVTEQEASMLMQNSEPLSQDELAVLAVGSQMQSSGPLVPSNAQFPGICTDGSRILMKGQLVNLEKKEITLADASSKVLVAELDGVILACEIIKDDMPATDWTEAVDATIRFLKKRVPPMEHAIFASWAKKYFANTKPTKSQAEATSIFIMLRAKKGVPVFDLESDVPRGVYLPPNGR